MTAIPAYKQNPYFGEMPVNAFNSYPYMARWLGLSVDRRDEIEKWTSTNMKGQYQIRLTPWMVRASTPHYEKPEWSSFAVYCHDVRDLILLKLWFPDID